MPPAVRDCKVLFLLESVSFKYDGINFSGREKPMPAISRFCILVVFLCCRLLAVAEEAPGLLLAVDCPAQIDPAPYLVSEKFDGVRAYWNGQRLRYRSGREVPAPAWLLAGLPAQPVDGELWLGRGRFEALASLLQQGDPDDPRWREVSYLLFELPEGSGDFAQRAQTLAQLSAEAGHPWLRAVPQRRVADRRALQALLDEVVAGGGEGLMLHRADAPLATGRGDVLCKLKPWHDAEATVVGHLPGKGRLTGKIGALEVELPDGRRLRLGSGLSDAVRAQPPPLGSRVTYRYRGLTANGLPRFASFLRMRADF
jgi:DNA ligase 1